MLLEAGVPYILLMGKDLVYQVLLGSDPVAVHKLLLMFSRLVLPGTLTVTRIGRYGMDRYVESFLSPL